MNSLTRDLARLCRARTEEAAHRGHGPWSQRFHLMPEAGWLNDPNGLCQKDGMFHAYYQNSPFDVDGGLKCWGHATSRDLVTWEPGGVVLVPDTPFDCHGVYSGSSVVHGAASTPSTPATSSARNPGASSTTCSTAGSPTPCSWRATTAASLAPSAWS